MPGKFALKQTSAGKYMFNLKAGNGQIILTSESYASKSGALGGVESVRTNARMDERYDRRTSTSGKPYFVLVAANKEPIGRSEMYSSTSAMENGIASVKKNAPAAKVEEKA